MDLARVYRAAKAHSMTAITAMAIDSCAGFQMPDPELSRTWKEDKERAIRKNMLLDAERAQILRYLRARLFPDAEHIKADHPFIARHRILIPFFWIWRIFRGLIRRRKAIRQEFQLVRTAGEKAGK